MAVSPAAISVVSAGSPPSLAPAPSSQLLISPRGFAQPCSITQRQWIIPPRPKPGRKPATDTPPTKRKAQNRAAQRAFRERRAAKVGELEEHIKQIEDEDEREQTELREQIAKLEDDVERYQGDVMAWRERAEGLERDLVQERIASQRIQSELRLLREGETKVADAVPLPPRKSKHSHSVAISQQSKEVSQGAEAFQAQSMGCGNCSQDSRCECIEQAFDITNSTSTQDSALDALKRPHSPPRKTARNKRACNDRRKTGEDELATDFTTKYPSKQSAGPRNINFELSKQAVASLSPATVQDPCGFCSDGTPCVCAELQTEISAEEDGSRLAPLLSQYTPPPSENDVILSSSANLQPQTLRQNSHHSKPLSTNPCANGPGTCAQCRSDPRSTLFCKSLAAMRGPTSNPSDGCCGGSRETGGCCRDQPPDRAQEIERPMLNCADTYTTLSRHPYYDEASKEPEKWLGRLDTRSQTGGIEGRPAMEVEAASIMGVLKFFDRRFSRG
ncbi:MAG: hypothetical protein M1827_000241 [Pycnora praestabilis]|nr:MAG: hypothetical protein M1827_000241 [Pycnora praestabilis]